MTDSTSYPSVAGSLFVWSRPKSTLALDEYHDWYNTEHGPLRMKLEFILVGSRYKSRDLNPPLWLATYDVAALSCFDDPRYRILREQRSPREQILLNREMDYLDRRIYQTLSVRGHSEEPAPVIMAVTFVVKQDLAEEIHAWYQQVNRK
jgi:hypothetical protein